MEQHTNVPQYPHNLFLKVLEGVERGLPRLTSFQEVSDKKCYVLKLALLTFYHRMTFFAIGR
jgi:hypothetical protein